MFHRPNSQRKPRDCAKKDKEFPPSVPLEVIDTEQEGIVFSGEIRDGRPAIEAGTIEKLVERLTYEKYSDAKFVKAFMVTFYSFSSPDELLYLLIQRFSIQCPEWMSKNEKETFERTVKRVVMLRVFNVLKYWLNTAFYDFDEDFALLSILEEFIDEMNTVEHTTYRNVANSLRNYIKRKLANRNRENDDFVSAQPPNPDIPIAITPQNKNNILTYSPVEIARQLALIEYSLYNAIRPSECLSQNWISLEKERLAPNILKMVSHFGKISCWVKSEILKCTDLNQRIQTLKLFIDIAENCFKFNNFNAVVEIISGLYSSSIFRLKQTWAGLSKKTISICEEMHATVESKNNFKELRRELLRDEPPCIPYLGMYLTDLSLIESDSSSFAGLINFRKCELLSNVIHELKAYQNTPYVFKEVSIVQDYLNNIVTLEGEDYDKLSLEREPRIPQNQ